MASMWAPTAPPALSIWTVTEISIWWSGRTTAPLATYENTTPRGVGFTVTITPEQDSAPTISGDQSITVLEGGSVVLTAADFVGTDIEDDDTTLSYTVSALVAGTVQVGGASVSTFSAAQLRSGAVSFVHDGSETLTGSFDVSAVDSDGASSAAIKISATVKVNSLPTISGDQLIPVLKGGSVVLTAADFVGTDIEDDDTTLSYTVSALVAGTVKIGHTSVSTFTAAQLAGGAVSFVHNGSEVAGSFDVSVKDSNGASSAAITIKVNDAPVLTGLGSVSFAENVVNATPQLLDVDVTFTDAEGNFDGGTLSLTGLLTEDTVSVRNQGTGAGEIGFDGTNVSYGNVVIGTLAGGSAGADLTITFNAAASSEAIDALIQNLTYANSSDAPTTSRELLLNVTDADGATLDVTGADLGVTSVSTFAPLTGAANPLPTIDVSSYLMVEYGIAPSFVDLDGDGDLDLVVGRSTARCAALRTTALTGLDELVGRQRPFLSNWFDYHSAPSFVDLDGDGDLDLVVGGEFGPLRYFRNDGSRSTPSFIERFGAEQSVRSQKCGLLQHPQLWRS